MVQLEILSGRAAGNWHVVRRFPFAIGRGQSSDLRVEEDGVWDRHAVISLASGEGFMITAEQGALLAVNDLPSSERFLKSGDQLALGSVRMRFWLSEARQRGLALREMLVWSIIIAVFAAQTAIIAWLW